MTETLRPARICVALLAALDAAEGRSRARKRDQTADAIGLSLRRELLERVARDDPEPEAFEQWLLDHVEASAAPGAARATARAVLDEWRLAHRLDSFAAWLELGAPSADAGTG
ncbi:type III secretion fhipep protein [Ramlibacter rhizophilus]|uniref:Type III secretion fhipep protein n=1 Tax=Ramlibacter rhizophilus TaxID=1781167 RepID=A0A4Z0BGL7_9BURK|nr:type III secretion fhipep protein [Ramlibacter rhizophilus]TFY98466.1 type III secretion fhipep protein [Ramlibacter rhizophilus]